MNQHVFTAIRKRRPITNSWGWLLKVRLIELIRSLNVAAVIELSSYKWRRTKWSGSKQIKETFWILYFILFNSFTFYMIWFIHSDALMIKPLLYPYPWYHKRFPRIRNRSSHFEIITKTFFLKYQTKHWMSFIILVHLQILVNLLKTNFITQIFIKSFSFSKISRKNLCRSLFHDKKTLS